MLPLLDAAEEAASTIITSLVSRLRSVGIGNMAMDDRGRSEAEEDVQWGMKTFEEAPDGPDSLGCGLRAPLKLVAARLTLSAMRGRLCGGSAMSRDGGGRDEMVSFPG